MSGPAIKVSGNRLLASMKDVTVSRRVATNVLIAACFIHVPVIALIELVLHGGTRLSAIIACLCIAMLPLFCAMFSKNLCYVGAALSVTLVAQSALLVSLFAGHPWQVEMNFYYLAVIAMIATLFDTPLLTATVALLVVLLVGLDRWCPDAVYPGAAASRAFCCTSPS